MKENVETLGKKSIEVCILSIVLTDCMTLDKSLTFIDPQFPHLYNFSIIPLEAV